MTRNVVCSRHRATVEWLKKQNIHIDEFITHVTSVEQIRGAIVYGNLPMHLAAECKTLYTIDMQVPADRRGTELTIEDLDRYGAKLSGYIVKRVDEK